MERSSIDTNETLLPVLVGWNIWLKTSCVGFPRFSQPLPAFALFFPLGSTLWILLRISSACIDSEYFRVVVLPRSRASLDEFDGFVFHALTNVSYRFVLSSFVYCTKKQNEDLIGHTWARAKACTASVSHWAAEMLCSSGAESQMGKYHRRV